MNTIKVYPTKASALNAHHPLAGAPRVEGVDWPYDSFTCRRLTDGSFTEDPKQAYQPAPAPKAEAAEKPAGLTTKAQDSVDGAAAARMPPAKND